MTDDYLARIGNLIRDARKHRGWTQQQLADVLDTSQSAVNRIERGHQNLTLEMLARIGEALDSEIVSLGARPDAPAGRPARPRCPGSIDVKSSKNAGVALLCASPAQPRAVRRCARSPASRRSTGSSRCSPASACRPAGSTRTTTSRSSRRPTSTWARIDEEAARRTRSIIMFLGPLMHREDTFELPYAGGCDLGTRTVEPHMAALRPFGLEVKATEGSYHATVNRAVSPTRPIVLTERGDTVTENALLAAARHDGVTVIRNASPNYMVQDLCFFLEQARRAHRRRRHHHADRARHARDRRRRRLRAVRGPDRGDVAARRGDRDRLRDHHPAGADRVPRDRAGAAGGDGLPLRAAARSTSPPTGTPGWSTSPPGTPSCTPPSTRSTRCRSPGLNIDNLPFFAVIAAVAEGQTLLHDWVYENRAIYLTELTKLGASVKLLDPHRVMIEGPTRWSRHRDRLPARAAPGGGDPAGDAGVEGHVGAALGLRHQPRLRGPRRPGSTTSAPASRPSATSEAPLEHGPTAVGASRPTLMAGRALSRSRQSRCRPGSTGRVGGGGAVMSAVIRGSGCVFGPLSRCQSFSASIRLPRSARSRKTPVARRALVDRDVTEVARRHRGLALGAGHLASLAHAPKVLRDARPSRPAR